MRFAGSRLKAGQSVPLAALLTDLNLSAMPSRDNRRMAHALSPAISWVQQAAHDPVELARSIIVIGCALALIAAGQALPSF